MYNVYLHTHKNQPHHPKNESKRSSGIEREHKDITCAVRLPKTMYDKLCRAADMENSSLSDIIREGLIEKIDSVFDQHVQKEMKEHKIKAELERLGIDPRKISEGALGELLSRERPRRTYVLQAIYRSGARLDRNMVLSCPYQELRVFVLSRRRGRWSRGESRGRARF